MNKLKIRKVIFNLIFVFLFIYALLKCLNVVRYNCYFLMESNDLLEHNQELSDSLTNNINNFYKSSVYFSPLFVLTLYFTLKHFNVLKRKKKYFIFYVLFVAVLLFYIIGNNIVEEELKSKSYNFFSWNNVYFYTFYLSGFIIPLTVINARFSLIYLYNEYQIEINTLFTMMKKFFNYLKIRIKEKRTLHLEEKIKEYEEELKKIENE